MGSRVGSVPVPHLSQDLCCPAECLMVADTQHFSKVMDDVRWSVSRPQENPLAVLFHLASLSGETCPKLTGGHRKGERVFWGVMWRLTTQYVCFVHERVYARIQSSGCPRVPPWDA